MRTFLFTLLSLLAFIAAANNSPTIIRVRILDGSVIRVPLQNDASSTTLTSLLSSAGVNVDSQNKDFEVRVGTPGRSTRDLKLSGSDIDKTAAELGLEHGSMLTLVSTKASGPPNTSAPSTQKPDSEDGYRYDPFPDLAKSTSFSALSRRSRALAGASRGRSYGDVSRVRDAMHTVEPQSDGALGRVYVCRVGAARFQNHCVVSNSASVSGAKKKNKQKSEPQVENRIGLLFGTINKERVDQSRKIARTSLSSTREDQKMCDVAKVHAIWEPPLQTPLVNGRHYDEDCLLASYPGVSSEARRKETNPEKAIRVASYLGLRPIGWIFSYADENRHEDGDALPVHGRDAIVGSKLQIETMKLLGRDEGKKFVTLALDGRVGATEAFQLSDVCVQMVAEGVLTAPIVDETLKSTRYVTLRDPVVVAGDETKQLDSVLLLINTAMLSHVGLYSGGENASPGGNVKRNSGALLTKTRKRILSALEDNESGRVLQELCDFDVLLALDTMIGRNEMKELCELVKKFARGQKKGARLGDHLRLTLQSILGG